jgi:flavin-dependent dehydrogenase
LDTVSKNHLKVRAKIIAGADGPLSLIGRLAGSANKSFMPAIHRNPSVILKDTDCCKVFFSPYISCGYGWLFPKTRSINIGVGTFFERKTIHSEHKAENNKQGIFVDSGNSDLGKGSSDSNLIGDAERTDVPLKNILAAFIRHLEFSGILAGGVNSQHSVFNNISNIGDNKKENICQPLPPENKNSAKQGKSLETYNQFMPAVTGLIPDSGIVENPGTKDGIILCGDAAGLCNPITGAGIYNAIYSARLASESIVKSLNLNDLSVLLEIKEIYNSRFGKSINRALRKKLLQKNNWPNLAQDMTTRNSFDNKDTIKFSDLIRQTWISFRDYWH